MKKYAIIAFLAMSSTELFAFCGFYVAKADAKIFNKTSQVILVRDGDYSVVTMSNDFKGDVKDFAMVIPVPTAIEREQINVAKQSLIDHLDAYTSPRLVEYFDDDPCMQRRVLAMEMMADSAMSRPATRSGAQSAVTTPTAKFGVRVMSASPSVRAQ